MRRLARTAHSSEIGANHSICTLIRLKRRLAVTISPESLFTLIGSYGLTEADATDFLVDAARSIVASSLP